MMKAAVFFSKDDVHIADVPKPNIGPGELLLKVVGVGLCGSDIDKIMYEAVPPGTILGHEVVGTVAELGEGVEGFRVGERLVVAHHVACEECHYCDRGSFSKCSLFRSTNLHPGGFAEYIRVPGPNVRMATFAIPDDISYERIVFTEPLACCVRAIERARLQPGDVVLLVGMGTIGLLFTQLIKLQGAIVLGSDPLEDRLELAKGYGADVVINPRLDSLEDIVREATEGRGVDTVLSTVASQTIVDQALLLVRDGGVIHFFAGKRGGLNITLDINELYEREVGIITTYSSSPRALREAFRLIVEGDVRTEGLISHRLPLSEVLQGVRMMVRHEARKVYFEVVS
jgi:L-iditol 2-dehydrogenase